MIALRVLLNFFGLLLAAVALLATLIATFAVIALALVWWREGRLNQDDLSLLRWWGGMAILGVGCTWAGFRLARSHHEPDDPLPASFTLTHSKSGRQERFVQMFAGTVYVVCLGAWLWIRVEGSPAARWLQVTGWMALIYLGLSLRIFLHELGHLAAARIVRLEVQTVRVGAGPPLWSARTQEGVLWEWRLWPAGGWVEALQRDSSEFRRRHLVFIAGGPLMDALLILALWLACYHQGSNVPATAARFLPTAFDSVVFVLFCSLCLSAFLGLVPRRVFIDGRQLYSDGWWLVEFWRLRTEEVPNLLFQQAGHRIRTFWKDGQRQKAWAELADVFVRHPRHALPIILLEARLHREAKDLDAEAACLARAIQASQGVVAGVAGEIWAHYTAFQACNSGLEAARTNCAALLLSEQDPARRVTILDALACIPLLHEGTRALLPDAEAWCREALTLTPDDASLQGTQGALLIEQRRLEEGMAILREVFALLDSNYVRGIVAFYLALAAHQSGLLEEMVKYQQIAKQFCIQPVLRGRLLAELPDV